VESSLQEAQEELIGEIQKKAAKQDVALMRTPLGFGFAPMKDGQVVKPDSFKQLSEAEQEEIKNKIEALQDELSTLVQTRFPGIEKEKRDEIRDMDRETAGATIEFAIAEARAAFPDIEPIQTYLNEVAEDLALNFHLFLALAHAGEGAPLQVRLAHPALQRYAVNVMDAVYEDDGAEKCAPIIEESDPTYSNLIGRIEHLPKEGALITDFTLIKPGALHRANGGFLILDARDLLMAPFSWAGLKRCLKTNAIRISSAAEQLSLVSTISLEPDVIPLSVKVALIGDRELFYLLSALDPDFPELFKVQADFDDDMDRSEESLAAMSRVVAALASSKSLMPLHKSAVARLLEQVSRLSGDAQKLSLRVGEVADIMREADHWARQAGAKVIGGDHVTRTIEERRRRAGRLRERSVEMMTREILTIQTTGAVVGQVNGLSVLSLGESTFGRPSRITARTRLGKGEVVDIEREVKLGGPLHSKGVLILSSFLATRYSGAAPMSLWASIVFEQSYGGVDGDSASSAELYALLSSLSGVPIRQDYAVTGSVDQFGRVQAIGGVNEKIEGFFELCAERGLTGTQGVLIPQSNLQHLNLRQEVAAAVRDGKFAIHAVETIDEGIELLTGTPAGAPDENGAFPEGGINALVAARLAEFAEARKSFVKDEKARE
jgi:lon-related putative ATP-dependent protease